MTRPAEITNAPEHVTSVFEKIGADGRLWYLSFCRCGWSGPPKLTEMAAEDVAADHISAVCESDEMDYGAGGA